MITATSGLSVIAEGEEYIVKLMEWLNYHHLLYFWTVARQGTIARASEELRLAQPTISGQIRALEHQLGEKLFQRAGRNLVLTEIGHVVYRYADDIFSIGRELMDTLKDRPTGRPVRFQVGVADEVTKIIAYRLLEPALRLTPPVHIVCRDGASDRLLTELATHALDLVIADSPAPPHLRVKVFNHLLGESDTAFFAPAALASRLRRRFPESLQEVPMVLPSVDTAVRRGLNAWFDANGLRPRIVAEFEDTALMKTFALDTGAVFPAPVVIAKDIGRLYGVRAIGLTGSVREHYYAISAERRLKHPGVLAITEAARDGLFK